MLIGVCLCRRFGRVAQKKPHRDDHTAITVDQCVYIGLVIRLGLRFQKPHINAEIRLRIQHAFPSRLVKAVVVNPTRIGDLTGRESDGWTGQSKR